MELDEFKKLAEQYGACEHYKLERLGICFYIDWCAGGITGNSCWGQDPRPVDPDEPADGIPELDHFLSSVTPSLTFMQYRLLNSVIQKGTTSGSPEYYGNYREYAYLGVNVEALYEKLVELNITMVLNPTSSFNM